LSDTATQLPPARRNKTRQGNTWGGDCGGLAREIVTLNRELGELDALISEKVIEHQHTQVLLSMPGVGAVLAAEFLGATGGDITVSSQPTGSRASSGSPRRRGTPAGSAETTTGPGATTAGC
jgi:transposase